MPPRDPPATELLGAASTEQVHVGVALDLPLRRLFTYRVPPELAARAGVGHRVVVPFRGKPRIGFVVERHDAPPLAQARHGAIARDGREPAAERVRVAQCGQPRDRLHEGILHHVLRLARRYARERDGVDHRCEVVVQLGHGVTLAAPRRFDELGELAHADRDARG